MIGTDLAMPVRTAFETRTGLAYELTTDIDVGAYYLYQPAAVFFVDGIRYDPANRGRWMRPMIEIFDDGGGDIADMSFSTPLTEADLNHWVNSDGNDL